MAAIAHLHEEQLTQQSHTGNLTYVTKLTMAGGGFVGSAKYLLIVHARVGGDDVQRRFKFQTQIGGVTPTGAVHHIEPRFAGTSSILWNSYTFGTVFTTAGSPGDITFQIAPAQITSTTAYADSIQIFAMRLDADLTENTDWFWDEDTTQSVHATAPSWDTRASTTFTPSAGDDWLVLAYGQVYINSNNRNAMYRINYDSGTSVAPLWTGEGEDNFDEMAWALSRVYNLDGAEHTFTVESSDDDTGSNDHRRSGILALNLAKFETKIFNWTEAQYVHSSGDAWEEIFDMEVTPTTAGAWIIIGSAIFDTASLNYHARIRVQLAGTTVPAGDDLHGQHSPNDVTDELPMSLLSYHPSLAASLQNIDVDGYVSADTNSRIQHRSFVGFSLELAAAGAAFSIDGASTITPSVAASALLYNLNASIAGASSIDLAVASALNYTLNASIAGASTVVLAIAAALQFGEKIIAGDVTITPSVNATMAYNLNASIAGDSTITAAVAAAMDYSLNASINGASTVTPSVAAAMAYNLNAELTGDVTINETIASNMIYQSAGDDPSPPGPRSPGMEMF